MHLVPLLNVSVALFQDPFSADMYAIYNSKTFSPGIVLESQYV